MRERRGLSFMMDRISFTRHRRTIVLSRLTFRIL